MRVGVAFSFWAPHIAHVPLEVPKLWYDRFTDLEDGDVDRHSRQIYEAMTNFVDTALLNLTLILKGTPQYRSPAQGSIPGVSMWDETILVFTSDNGGRVDPWPTHAAMRQSLTSSHFVKFVTKTPLGDLSIRRWILSRPAWAHVLTLELSDDLGR